MKSSKLHAGQAIVARRIERAVKRAGAAANSPSSAKKRALAKDRWYASLGAKNPAE